MSNSTSRQIKLRDGRLLGYAEYGASQGKAVFFFHGTPSSRLSGRFLDGVAGRLNARIIATDRPGIGLSDFKPGRQYSDWPDDVTELADFLGIDRFAVLGVSNGGPHGAACAFKIPRRLTAVAIVGSPCPFNVPAANEQMSAVWRQRAFVGRRAPWLVRLFFMMVARNGRRDPAGAILRIHGGLSEPDRVVLGQPELAHLAGESLRETFRSGTRGAAWDYSLITRPWGFRLEEISMEVLLWHGEADATMPLRMGRYLADTIPNCRARFLPDEGHFSLTINHTEEILSALVL